MKLLLTTLILIFINIFASGQINLADSTVDVKALWYRHEVQSYSISKENIIIENGDTTFRKMRKCDVEMIVLDSTAKFFIVEWRYKNYSPDSDNDIIYEFEKLGQEMKITFKTDKSGKFVDILYWRDTRDSIMKVTKKLKKAYKGDIEKIQAISGIKDMYKTKQNITNLAMNEINQYLYFFGEKFKKGEPKEEHLKVSSFMRYEPFDAYYTHYLDKIDAKESNYVIRSSGEIDSQQLTDATYDYMLSWAEVIGTEIPNPEDFSVVSHESRLSSRIHDSGWLVFSVETKIIESYNIIDIKECIIEIK